MVTPSESQTPVKTGEKTLYLFRLSETRCLSHDGYIQIGIFSHSIERHIELNPTINWVEVHWYPDIFKNRYKRATFQSHQRVSGGKDSCEERPRDFPNDQPEVTIQEKTRLDRTV